MIVASTIHTPGVTAADLQTRIIQRRLRLSPSVARIAADHVYGSRQRSDFALIAALTASRVASYAEVHS